MRVNKKYHGAPRYHGKTGTVLAISLKAGSDRLDVVTVLLDGGDELQGTAEKFDVLDDNDRD